MRSFLVMALLAAGTAAGLSQEAGESAPASQPPAYLDDRSSPETLLKSLYNAINRKEFARAWDYFGDTKPAANLEAYAAGYDGIDRIEIAVGNVSTEGAAGSTYSSVPVGLVAHRTDGAEQVFAGCYTTRLANPAIQGEPFRGLHIETGKLAAAEQPYEQAVPAKCGDGPDPEPHDAALERTSAAFLATYRGNCTSIEPSTTADQLKPERHAIAYHYESDGPDEPERKTELLSYPCTMAAYNESHVYYLYDDTDGLRQVTFATPELDIRYENDDSEGKVESIDIVGYTARDTATNSFYDKDSKSITAYAKWRGVGDASAGGTWLFRNGAFTLVTYDVDASYDGEINPQTIYEQNSAP